MYDICVAQIAQVSANVQFEEVFTIEQKTCQNHEREEKAEKSAVAMVCKF
jgi:hypothetical protein